jgi:hypothetical protein
MKGRRLPVSLPHAPFPSRGGTAPCGLVFRSRGCQRPRPRAWDLISRMVPAGDGGAEIAGISQVPRAPYVHMPCSQTPAGPSSPRHYSESVLLPPAQRRRLLQRLSFEALSHGLCTRCLRFVPPLLTTTQDALPAGGWPLPGGIGYPLGSVERFQPSTRHPPLLGFLGAMSSQSAVGTRPPSTSTPHCPACWARR